MHSSSAAADVQSIEHVGGNQCLLGGSTARIHCETDGFPQPSIVFLMGTTPVNTSDGHFSQECEDLVIMGVRAEDMGTYVCEADNGLGDDTSDVFTGTYCSKPQARWNIVPNNSSSKPTIIYQPLLL